VREIWQPESHPNLIVVILGRDRMRYFFRHSPLPGANDEKRRIIWIGYPGLRPLRSLTLGYHLPPFRASKMDGKDRCHQATRMFALQSYVNELQLEFPRPKLTIGT
jgi:hypothetical protein